MTAGGSDRLPGPSAGGLGRFRLRSSGIAMPQGTWRTRRRVKNPCRPAPVWPQTAAGEQWRAVLVKWLAAAALEIIP